MVDKLSQKKRIIEYLSRKTNDGKPFTLSAMKAFQKLRITQLPSRMSELIAEGYPIKKEMVYKRDKDGHIITHYMLYSLGESQ